MDFQPSACSAYEWNTPKLVYNAVLVILMFVDRNENLTLIGVKGCLK